MTAGQPESSKMICSGVIPDGGKFKLSVYPPSRIFVMKSFFQIQSNRQSQSQIRIQVGYDVFQKWTKRLIVRLVSECRSKSQQ